MPVPTRSVPGLHWHVDRFDRVATFQVSVKMDDVERARRGCPVARLMIDAADQMGAPASAKLRALAEIVDYLENNP